MGMGSRITKEQTIRIGEKVVIEGPSPSASFCVVFEDDGETGYFYALDMSRQDDPILDALHIYDVAVVTDRDIPSQVQIVWSGDSHKAALIINEYFHGVFDFETKRGYCRDGFPRRRGDWCTQAHDWDDRAVDLFR